MTAPDQRQLKKNSRNNRSNEAPQKEPQKRPEKGPVKEAVKGHKAIDDRAHETSGTFNKSSARKRKKRTLKVSNRFF